MKSNLDILHNIPLNEFTSWKVGGNAEFYCAPTTENEMEEALKLAYKNHWPVTLLGGGTNVLISDKGIQGLVIHCHKMVGVQIISQDKQVVIECLAGTPKSEILKEFMKLRLRPAIFLAGLPGDMAGGVVMNAGVGHDISPREFHEIVHSFDVLECTKTGEVIKKSFQKDEIEWSYRKSKNWQPGVITKVRVCWENKPDDNVLKEVRDGNKRRKSTQPLAFPSCGSVFKNPQGNYAGALIEKSGLKGKMVGGAQVSEKHANFIINTGVATATDIHTLISLVQKVVEEKFSIHLTNEVVYLGQWEATQF